MSTALPPSTLMVVALLPAALARLHGTFALFPVALVLAVVVPLVGLLVVQNVRLPIYLTTVALLPAVLARLRGTFAPFPGAGIGLPCSTSRPHWWTDQVGCRIKYDFKH